MAELFDPNKNYDQLGTQAQETSSYAQDYSTVQANPYEAATLFQPQTFGGEPHAYNPEAYNEMPYESALEGQASSWDPRGQMQPQTPIHHMPPAPTFGLPPNVSGNVQEEAAVEKKASRFKLKRKKSAKEAQMPLETNIGIYDDTVNDTPQRPKAKKSSVPIFIMGMAVGMAIMFAGNMFMTNVMQDTSSNKFKEIERRAMQMQKPTMPTSEAKTASTVKAP